MSATQLVGAPRLARLVGDLSQERPAYRTLADSLRRAIADGRVPVGARLPSERDLTTALGLSRTTVSRAYDVLREAGYLDSRRGSGTLAALPHGTHHRAGGPIFHAMVPEGAIDLTCAATRAPAGALDAYERALERLPGYLAGPGYLTVGVPELRELVARRYTERGAPTTPDQVIVTSGSLTALGIAVRTLVGRGDRVLVEEPSYPNTVTMLRDAGARLTTVPVDPRDGWDLDEATATVARTGARAAFLIPDFHNPTGALLDDDGRRRLASALVRSGTVTVVDETIAEMDLGGPGALPLPFAAHAPRAVTVGGASKSHWGGLRVGWLRVPPGESARFVDAKVLSDLGAPVLEQLVLAELLRVSPGPTPEHRDDLRASRDALVAALGTHLPDLVVRVPRGGLTLWCRLPDDLSGSALAHAAADEGLVVAAGPRFAVHGGLDGWLRLPYVLPPAEMTEAVVRLARAAARVRGTDRPGPRAGRAAASERCPIVA
ncbi:PLP-dependent aminotransferase family protein [Phycicoccus sp. CSK15P-2]|uniref:MocR-like transcription factor YczR n=1 Tax=Phycicoccus sp. CSK15P-2 TaxID=2807627 RepID=UPI0019512D8E|nr:PLP-dependent aminotransferase family protein [Phycicoccus sp. CSK15P-2]MBM6404263.1 PLP-dependent aminotransferase family protein [Phycicoccus sp. CSK15P-2]